MNIKELIEYQEQTIDLVKRSKSATPMLDGLKLLLKYNPCRDIEIADAFEVGLSFPVNSKFEITKEDIDTLLSLEWVFDQLHNEWFYEV